MMDILRENRFTQRDSPGGFPQGGSPRERDPPADSQRNPPGYTRGGCPQGTPQGIFQGDLQNQQRNWISGGPWGPLGGLLEPPALSSMNVARKMDR